MSIARLMQQAAAGVSTGPAGISYSYNDVLYTGKRLYTSIDGYILFAEFINSGTQMRSTCQEGVIIYDLATPYTVSSGVTVSSVDWVTIDRYTDATRSIFSTRSEITRYDINAGLAYRYEANQTTDIYSIDGTSGNSLPLITTSLSPFTETPNSNNCTASMYIKKSGGGIAIVQTGVNLGKIYLRNYANDTTTVVSSFSTLDFDSVALDFNLIGLIALSVDGQTLSIVTRRTSLTSAYDVHKWTLSTPFDLSTAGSVTTTLGGSTSAFNLPNGKIFNDYAISGKLLSWENYGAMKVLSYTVDGDANTFSIFSSGNRTKLGNYYSVNMYRSYFDNGNYVIELNFGGSGFVFGPLPTPYEWEWQDRNFTEGTNATVLWGWGASTGDFVPQDGQMNADRTVLYGNFYSSTYRLTSRLFGTAGDPRTVGSSTSPAGSSNVTFTGWQNSFQNAVLWLDRNANKIHLVDTTNNTLGKYFIFNLNVDGTYAGTWDANPTGFSGGDFKGMYNLQPLTSDGKYFVHRGVSITEFYVIELNVPYNPIQGYTLVKTIPIKGIYPNGSLQTPLVAIDSMYVQDSIVFFSSENANKTFKVDITIPGVLPAAAPAEWTDPDLANASYDSVSFSVLSRAEQVSSLFFTPDGTGMYVVDASLDNVVQYSLSSAWDITSASHVQNLLVRSQEGQPKAVFFKPDGTKMYVIGAASDAVQEYDLSVAWDISTASHLQSFSVSAQQITPTAVFFKPDGTKFYIGGESSLIHEYTLSTAWDISTSSYVQNFSAARSMGVFFKPDGSKLYVVHEIGDKINEYTLSTAWDVSTASYVQDFSVAAQDTGPSGVFFKSDGSKMYVIGYGTDTIYQYSTA
jgi:hypothetical protein